MARKRTYAPLSVFLNGRFVGELNRQPNGTVEFRYDPSWLDWEHNMPVSLSLPLRESRFTGEPVIAVFDNLLPDNEVIRRQIAEQLGAQGRDAYSLLEALGRDCVGALQFLPKGIEPEGLDKVSGRAISDKEIGRRLRNLASAPLGVGDDDDFRISIAGAQEKTALLRARSKWLLPKGSTPTTHILKPTIGQLPNGIDLSFSVENEHFCMTLTAALGLPAAKTEILDFDGVRTLVVERFDRRWTKGRKRLLRLPQEDCCQALAVPWGQKYESDGGPDIPSILDLLQGSDTPEQDRRLFLKAQIVYWLLAATDGHAKNVSIFLNPGGRFNLTPLYDIMSAQPNFDAGQINLKQLKLAMAVGNSRYYRIRQIMPQHFEQTAKASGVPVKTVGEIFDELRSDFSKALEATKAAMPPRFPQQLVASIEQGATARLQHLELVAG